MAKDEKESTEQTADLNRRDVLVGGAAAAVMAAVPEVAAAQSSSFRNFPYAGVYMDPTYNTTFANAYSVNNIVTVHNLIQQQSDLFPDRSHLWWGSYQRLVVKDAAKWGSQAAFDNWPAYVAEARIDLEKQPANFADLKNATNPFVPTQSFANLQAHLDEVVRIALWDYAIPITIHVNQKRRRHHGLTAVWAPEPPWTSAPDPNTNSLIINIDCPQGGWQGYAIWPSRSPGDPPPPDNNKIKTFVASWTVPQRPVDQENQIIFIFNGLESVSALNAVGGILQPVLQWTKSDGWAVRNWYIRADFDPAYGDNSKLPPLDQSASNYNTPGYQRDNRTYSTGVTVQTDDTITGTIVLGQTDSHTGLSTYTCSFAIDNKPQTDLDLHTPGIPELVCAVCAVESYYVDKPLSSWRNYYPANAIKISIIGLSTQQSVISPITWTTNMPKLGADYNTAPNGTGDTVTFMLA
jgi:hypothetical protein